MRTDRNLDILRALAVLTVLVAHCLPESPAQQLAGHYAVLIFFVHTSLVLLLSLRRQAGNSLSAFALTIRFYTQRVFRIYPLSILCVLATVLFKISWPNAQFAVRSGVSIAANLFLVQNFRRGEPSISPPLWSLPYELQMYAVLPFLFWLLKGRMTHVAVGITAVSLLVSFPQALVNPLHGAGITSYIPCFMGGVLAYAAYESKKVLPGWLWPAAIGAVGIIYSRTAGPLVFDWFACIGLGLLVPRFQQFSPGLFSKVCASVARYSYGIYVAHAPLLWLCFQRLTFLPMGGARWFAFGVSICIVPVVLYHGIEEPMIAAGKTLSERISPGRDSARNGVAEVVYTGS